MGTPNGPLKARLWAAAIVAGVAAVAVLVVVVFQFGRYHPSPPSLTAHPNAAIPGEILFEDGRGCIQLVAASGAWRREVLCPGTYAVSWVDHDHIAFPEPASLGAGAWTEFGLQSGERKTIRVAAADLGPSPVSPKGERAVVEGGEVAVISTSGARTVIASFDVPENSAVQFRVWSPDGEWMLLAWWNRDGEEETWVVSRDGKTQGTLLREADQRQLAPSWWIDGFGYEPEVAGLAP